jgi:V/A-type H+/Na+-transporting ATPase subunit D
VADIKLTKNELRAQQNKLIQLDRYLPTLQLKKAMLQLQVNETLAELEKLQHECSIRHKHVEGYATLLEEKTYIDIPSRVVVKSIKKEHENIAGVEIPLYKGVIFEEIHYNLFETPPWVDPAIEGIKRLYDIYAHIDIVVEKKHALEEELRQISIRVNLFEKVLIPRAKKNIRKVRVFLGDQELTAVSQAKVAKKKIIQQKER